MIPSGTIVISSEEGETDGEHHYMWYVVTGVLLLYYTDNLPKHLCEFYITNCTRLKVDDFLQNYSLVLNIIHR